MDPSIRDRNDRCGADAQQDEPLHKDKLIGTTAWRGPIGNYPEVRSRVLARGDGYRVPGTMPWHRRRFIRVDRAHSRRHSGPRNYALDARAVHLSRSDARCASFEPAAYHLASISTRCSANGESTAPRAMACHCSGSICLRVLCIRGRCDCARCNLPAVAFSTFFNTSTQMPIVVQCSWTQMEITIFLVL